MSFWFVATPNTYDSERNPIRELVDLREAKDMGVAQNLDSQKSGGFNIARDIIETTILNARQYMENEVLGGKMSTDTVKLCKNEHADCAIWAAAGECEVNPNCKFPMRVWCGLWSVVERETDDRPLCMLPQTISILL